MSIGRTLMLHYNNGGKSSQWETIISPNSMAIYIYYNITIIYIFVLYFMYIVYNIHGICSPGIYRVSRAVAVSATSSPAGNFVS